MADKDNTPTVDNPDSTTEDQVTQFNSIGDAFAKAREARKPSEPELIEPEEKEEDTKEPEEVAEDSEATEEPEVTDAEDEGSDEDVLSKSEEIDFDTLTDDQKTALREKLEIKGHKAFAEMRVKLKEAEQKLSEVANSQASKLEQETVGSNIFADVTDAENLSKQIQQAEVNVEFFTDSLLKKQITKYDEESGDDKAGIEHDGKFYDKDFVLNYVEQQKAALRDGKVRQKQLESYSKLVEKQADMVAEKKVKLGIEAGSKAGEAYDKLLESQSFRAVARAMPDYAKELIDVFGRSVLAEQATAVKEKRPGPKGKITNATLPNSVGSDAANSTSAQIAALDKRLSQGVSSKAEMLRIARQKRQLLNNQ